MAAKTRSALLKMSRAIGAQPQRARYTRSTTVPSTR
jgi:hypothetical protein